MAVVARDNADVAELTAFLTTKGIPAATVSGTTDEHAIGEKVP